MLNRQLPKTIQILLTIVIVTTAHITTLPAAYSQAAEPVPPQQQVFGPAPVTPTDQPTFLGTLGSMAPMLAVCYLIFFFMVVRPQEARKKNQRALIDTLKRGEHVVTSGGLIGRVAGQEQDLVVLEVANNVKIKVEATHVVKRLGSEQKSEAA